MRWLLALALVVTAAAEAEEAPPKDAPPPESGPAPSCRILRLEIVDVKGPSRFADGWGHEFTVEIELTGDPRGLKLEWWELVSFEGSGWTSSSLLPSDEVRENLWQDHRVVNPDSPTWRPIETVADTGSEDVRTIRLVDRPTIPLGNVRLARGGGREYANLRRSLTIEVRARCGDRLWTAFLYQVLSEKEGKPGASLIAYGPSRIERPRPEPRAEDSAGGGKKKGDERALPR
jgi:hypothetical protein